MKKLKIIQIESFYTAFLQSVYEKHPYLESLPFTDQIDYLLSTGFSAGQNFVPFLNPQQWESHYIIQNNLWSQVKWANEKGKTDVQSLSEILLHQINSIGPDVLFISDVPGFDFSIISSFKRRPLIVAWLATVINQDLPWHEIDVILSGIGDVRDKIVHLGARSAEKFMSGAPHHAQSNRPGIIKNSIAFAGSFVPGIHDDRALQIDRLASQLTECEIDIYTAHPIHLSHPDRARRHPAVYGNELVRIYSEHTMVLDARGNFDPSGSKKLAETANMRIFEATRAGSLLITENSPNLSEYFKIGEEILTYNNFDELVSLVNYFATPKNHEKRTDIARKGYERCIREHGMESRATWLERILFKHLGIKDGQQIKHPQSTKINHYCTYFDSNYLARGIAMIRSLIRHDPYAHIHVLCLDQRTHDVLSNFGGEVSLIHIDELLSQDPEFAKARDNRSQIEWYFTATSCLVNFITRSRTEIQNLYYVDADLYFFDSVKPLLQESKGATAQLIEHRFSSHHMHLMVYGRFNVGWIGFSTSEEGLRLIQDYRQSCLEWCYDRLEEDRYGDQKYLERWPEKFPGCVVSEHKGANVAVWNISGRNLSLKDSRHWIDGDPLIFYHFQGVARLKSGNYVLKGDPMDFGNYFDLLYTPYLDELGEIEKEFDFSSRKIEATDIRYNSW